MKLYSTLENLLKTNSNDKQLQLLDNQGDLMLNKIHDLIDKTDEKLIGLLLENQEIREKFFIKIKEVYVFKTNDFKFFLNENKIDNSFTQYENRIGLSAGGKFIKDNPDVVLDFPYKDCLLEGGQSTDEGTDIYFEWDDKDQHYLEKKAKRKEIFFNTILAKDEIDRLLEPKAFTNFKHYTSSTDKSRLVPTFERDENGTIKDNLIIKGNNLLALHTLKSEFAGKVKLIYIDPPYNTGNDSFAYNDNFNHSTWLTFMRNRLLIAKDLLREDGVIFVHCDNNEQAYLKVLLDEIFERDNFISDIAISSSTPSGLKTAHKDKTIIKQRDSILVYKKREFSVKPQYSISTKWDTHYNYFLDDNLKLHSFKEILLKEKIISKDQKLENIDTQDKMFKSFYLKNSNNIFQTGKSMPEDIRKISLKFENKDKVIPYGDNQFALNGRRLSPLKASLNEVVNKSGFSIEISKLICDFWSDIDFNNTQNEGGISFPAGKKPEFLLLRIIRMITNENDIVMDYHLGSGTTAAVAHKMNRQYIGIEQMDYIENDSVLRLQNVINGDSTGISKSVNWQGGGSFIYLELAKNNQNAIEHIQNCESYEDLVLFFDEMCDKYFLHYNVKVKEFREVICKEENFKKLTLEQQKIMFAKMLDLNQLYVNVSDMEDTKFNLSENDIAITKDFYQL